MTCVDALIGNFDRHANNWGFIADRRTADILDLAPVYDCGSSLSPSLSREGMRERVEDPQQMREANMAAPYMAMNVGRQATQVRLLPDLGDRTPLQGGAAGTLAAPVRGGHGPHRGADPRTR